MFPGGRIRTLYCLTYLTSFENTANLSFFFLFTHIPFLGRTNEFKTLSMTSLFKADRASPPQWPSISLGSHYSAMQCRLPLSFLGFYLLYSPTPLAWLRKVFPDLMIWRTNIACGILNLIGYFKIKLLIKLRGPDFKEPRNSRRGRSFFKGNNLS